MAAGATYEPIATNTLSATATQIDFSSIPATYTDLRLVAVGSSTGANPSIRLNTVSTTTYSFTYVDGNGTSASTFSSTGASRLQVGFSGTFPVMQIVDIFSYAGSTNKTVLSTSSADQNGSGNITTVVGLWRNTAAVTAVRFYLPGGSFDIGSTFTLYGIKAA